jgi:hypothetical protein
MQYELEKQLPECKSKTPQSKVQLKVKVMEDTMESKKMCLGANLMDQSLAGAICESDMNWANEFEEGNPIGTPW